MSDVGSIQVVKRRSRHHSKTSLECLCAIVEALFTTILKISDPTMVRRVRHGPIGVPEIQSVLVESDELSEISVVGVVYVSLCRCRARFAGVRIAPGGVLGFDHQPSEQTVVPVSTDIAVVGEVDRSKLSGAHWRGIPAIQDRFALGSHRIGQRPRPHCLIWVEADGGAVRAQGVVFDQGGMERHAKSCRRALRRFDHERSIESVFDLGRPHGSVLGGKCSLGIDHVRERDLNAVAFVGPQHHWFGVGRTHTGSGVTGRFARKRGCINQPVGVVLSRVVVVGDRRVKSDHVISTQP